MWLDRSSTAEDLQQGEAVLGEAVVVHTNASGRAEFAVASGSTGDTPRVAVTDMITNTSGPLVKVPVSPSVIPRRRHAA